MILLDQWAVSVIILRLGITFCQEPRQSEMGEDACYLSGVKISDLVPFTVSQTSVDYQRPSWYLVGCFSLNKIPEISITRTTLIIWLEPQSTSIKEFLFLGFFNFLCLNCYFLGVDISWCPSHTDKTYIYRRRFRNPRHPRPLMYRGSPWGADICSTQNFDVIFGEGKKVLSASGS